MFEVQKNLDSTFFEDNKFAGVKNFGCQIFEGVFEDPLGVYNTNKN